jgi:DNA-binding transcriptional regulator YhcF (GntR family)
VEPIRKDSLADAVSERVLALIREGKYRAGDRLPTERETQGSSALAGHPCARAYATWRSWGCWIYTRAGA